MEAYDKAWRQQPDRIANAVYEGGDFTKQSLSNDQPALEIIRNSVEQARFLQLARILAKERDPWEDFVEDRAIQARRTDADWDVYPQSADSVARTLLRWHETLLLNAEKFAPEPRGGSPSAASG